MRPCLKTKTEMPLGIKTSIFCACVWVHLSCVCRGRRSPSVTLHVFWDWVSHWSLPRHHCLVGWLALEVLLPPLPQHVGVWRSLPLTQGASVGSEDLNLRSHVRAVNGGATELSPQPKRPLDRSSVWVRLSLLLLCCFHLSLLIST